MSKAAYTQVDVTAFVLFAVAAQPERGRSHSELTRMHLGTRDQVKTATTTLLSRGLITMGTHGIGLTFYPTVKLQQVLDAIHAQDAKLTPQCLRARAAVRGQRGQFTPTPVLLVDVPVAALPHDVESPGTTRLAAGNGAHPGEQPGRLDGVRREVVGPCDADLEDGSLDLDEEDHYAMKDREEFEAAVRKMTSKWPTPVPFYIHEIINRNYEAGKTAFFTAGELRGQMIVRGHDSPAPQTTDTK